MMSRSLLFLIAIAVFVSNSNSASNVDVSYSHRQTAHMEINPAIPEGSIIATLAATVPLSPVDSDPALVAIGENTWQVLIPWDQSTPLTQLFVSATQETTIVDIWPIQRPPFSSLEHELPVLCIDTDPGNLWAPDSGLYVFGENRNCLKRGAIWERPASFSWYEPGSEIPITEEIGLRIHGGSSRQQRQKGLRFYFDDYGDSPRIEYDFFNSRPIDFKRLIITDGLYTSRCVKSALVETMFIERGHLSSRYRSVVVYLNEEYWGIHVFRERIDEEFVETTHDLAKQDYTLVKDGRLVHGDLQEWSDFLLLFKQGHDFTSHDWWITVSQQLDIDAYLDWLLINIIVATADNGSAWNLAQLKVGDGPWQYIMWDEDSICIEGNASTDFFRLFSAESLEEIEEFKPPYFYSPGYSSRLKLATIFRGLMKNAVFRAQFRKHYYELTTGPLSAAGFNERLNQIAVGQLTEIPRHWQRWDWRSANCYQENIDKLKQWPDYRLQFMEPQFTAFMERYRQPVELSRFSACEHNGIRSLTWRTESEEGNAGFTLYRGSSPDEMQQLATWQTEPGLIGAGSLTEPHEYSYTDDTEDVTNPLYYRLAWNSTTGVETEIQWVAKTLDAATTSIVINEIQSDNEEVIADESGDYDDWIELYNKGTEPVNLEGMYLSDNLDKPLKWRIPSVQIAPDEYLVFWCDGEIDEGPLHTNFKLDADGESVGLFSSLEDGNQSIDSITFDNMEPNQCFGRYPNGENTWQTLARPSPGQINSDPLMLSLLTHQNPNQPEELELKLISSNQLVGGSIEFTSGCGTLILPFTETEVNTWVGKCTLTATSCDTLFIGVTDEDGQSDRVSLVYSATRIRSNREEIAFSADGRMSVLVEHQSGEDDQYLLLVTQLDPSLVGEINTLGYYEIYPLSESSNSFTLEFSYNDSDLSGNPATCLAVDTFDSESMKSYVDLESRTVSIQTRAGQVRFYRGLTEFSQVTDHRFLSVLQNFPNPVRTGTAIGFEIHHRNHIMCSIYDINGRLITQLANREFLPGSHDLFWNGRSASGDVQPTGLYFYIVKTPQASQVHRLLLVR